jgi:hypothetical protein
MSRPTVANDRRCVTTRRRYAADVPAETFHWKETRTHLTRVLREVPLELDAARGCWVSAGHDVVFTPPLVLKPTATPNSVDAYLRNLPETIGVTAILLMRAGASALGLWR